MLTFCLRLGRAFENCSNTSGQDMYLQIVAVISVLKTMAKRRFDSIGFEAESITVEFPTIGRISIVLKLSFNGVR